MREYEIQTKERKYTFFPFRVDEKLTIKEMRSFGWVDRGERTYYFDPYLEIDWDRSTATVKQDSEHYQVFKRIKPYTYNPVFIILEKIMLINSWIRKKLMLLFFCFTPLSLILGLIQIFSIGDPTGLLLFATTLAIIYIPTWIMCLTGKIARKVLRIEEKLKDNLERNGYAREQDIQ